MSSCELTLAFDRPDLTYHLGDTVSGTVQVRVLSKYHNCKLLLEREWRTHGRGSRDSWGHERLCLFEGDWEVGGREYPFSIIAPNGPATYHGHNLNVDWYVRARASGSSELDCAVEHEILLVPPEWDQPRSEISLGPTYRTPSSERVRETIVLGREPLNRAMRLFLIAPLPLLLRLISSNSALNVLELIAGLFGALALMEFLRITIGDWRPQVGPMGAVCSGVIGFLWVAGLLGLAYYSLLLADLVFGVTMGLVGLYPFCKSRRQRCLGQMIVEIQPTMIRRGSAINCMLQLTGSKSGIHPTAWATLLARENVFARPGTDYSFIPGPIVSEITSPLAPVGENSSSNSAKLQTRITIPEEAPVTFWGMSNFVGWEVALRITAKGVPAWNGSYPVTVCP